MEGFLKIIDRDDVKECHKSFPLWPDLMTYWDRAVKANSIHILEYLCTHHGMVTKIFYNGSTLKKLHEVRYWFDYFERKVHFLLNKVIETLYVDESDLGLTLKRYLFTRGYIPSGIVKWVPRAIDTWYLSTILPLAPRFRWQDDQMELLHHLMIVPSCFDAKHLTAGSFYRTYFRYDNFYGWTGYMMCGDTPGLFDNSNWLSPQHLDCLEALLRRDVTLFPWLGGKLKHHIAQHPELRIGTKLREVLGLDS